jgi:hypothetical protein
VKISTVFRKPGLALLAAVLGVSILGLTGTSAETPSASAADTRLTLSVNSAETGGTDAKPGDGICATATGTCSMRAAVEEANATSAAIDVLINVAPGFTGTITAPSSNANLMTTTSPTPLDATGAFFWIKRTMTIDLDNRLHVSAGTAHNYTAFWVDAPNVKLLNFTDIYSSQSVIIFSGNSSGSMLDGGSNLQSANDAANRTVGIVGGANNITIQNYTIGRMNNGGTQDAGITISAANKNGAAISNLTISNVTFDNTPNSVGGCDGTHGGGCASHGITITGDIAVNGMTVSNCTFRYFPSGNMPIRGTGAVASSNWDIHDNTFVDVNAGTSASNATILLPGVDLSGTNYIRNNVFDNTTKSTSTGQNYAISWDGTQGANSTTASNLFIQDNFFNGYGGSSIYLTKTGTVTVRRNTFGTASASQSTTTSEETATSSAMLTNYANSANRKILTWYPTSATVGNCALQVTVAAPTSGNIPSKPVTLDFYYTTKQTAEVYLGSIEGVTSAGTYTVPVPNPAAGYIRIQTQGTGSGQPESSQYSRTVAVGAPTVCVSDMKITMRAWANVPQGVTTHDAIIASSATEIPTGSFLTTGDLVWFTYTVTNTGTTTLNNVVVRDSHQAQVCVIATMSAGQTAGCARQELIT